MVGVAVNEKTFDRAKARPTTGTLGKAMDVLDAIALSPEPPRFTDLLNQLGVPRGTLHRQVSHLVQEGLVVANRDHAYELGPRLLQLASRAWSTNSFRRIAEPHLRALHEISGETVHLGVLSGHEVVYLDKVESRQAVRMHSQIGNTSPAYCTGVGKAMLSVLDDAAIADIAARTDFVRHTPTTLKNTTELAAEIAEIRRTGLAFDREEHEPGIHCVAAPIAAEESQFIAGLSITAPSFRVPMAQLEAYGDAVTATANAIKDDIVTRLGPRRS